MLRRFVVPALAAVALGIMLFPTSAVAKGRPNFLLCGFEDEKRSWVVPIYIDWENNGMRWAVADCLDSGGHPVGVSDDGKEGQEEEKPPVEEKPVIK